MRICAKLSFHVFYSFEEIRADSVHLIYKSYFRYAIPFCLSPDSLGLRLHSPHSAEYNECAVKYLKRSFYFYRKINVSGRIDDIDSFSFPERRCSSGCYSYSSLLLYLHPVHCRRALIHIADSIELSRMIQDSLCRCRLSGIYVCDNAYISGVFYYKFFFAHY